MIAMGWIAWSEIAAVLIGLTLLAVIVQRRRVRSRERAERFARPFGAEEEIILDRDFSRWRWIPASLRQRFSGITRVLIEEKNFEPCGGLAEVTDEMKLVISAQAALTLLGKNDRGFFPRLHSILVYPSGFRDRGRRRLGIDDDDRGGRDGEAWETGSVILSWDNVLAGARSGDDGMNVVIHEFAHQLDQYNGIADGVPLLRHRGDYVRWASVMGEHYEQLKAESLDRHLREPFLDPYGATHPAEFFAVASEAFFEDPHDLAEEHPDLYDELAKFYGLDPVSWTGKKSKSL